MQPLILSQISAFCIPAFRKGNVVPVHTMWAYEWIRVMVPPSARWNRVVSLMTQPLYSQGECPCYLLKRSHCGPQIQYGYFGKQKILFLLPGIKP